VVPPTERAQYAALFRQSAVDGYVSGAPARQLLGQSGLPKLSLRSIWDLADMDRDGALDEVECVVSEFFLCASRTQDPNDSTVSARLCCPQCLFCGAFVHYLSLLPDAVADCVCLLLWLWLCLCVCMHLYC